MNNELKAICTTYGQTLVASLFAVYSMGANDPTDYAKAAIAAILPPLMRWVNPKDIAYGLKK